MSAAPVYSAAQIATALGRSRWGVAKALKQIAPAGCAMVNGQKANAWELLQLPGSMRADLLQAARDRHFRNVDEMLGGAPALWRPSNEEGAPLRTVEISQESATAALRMKRALKRSMERAAGCKSLSQIEAAGLADYRAEFGYSISPRHWRRLIERVMNRDGGAHDWDRDEIYLPARIKRTPAEKTRGETVQVPILSAALKQIDAKGKLTTGQKDRAWLKACNQVSALIEEDQVPEREAKSAVVMALDVWGYLGSGEPLRRTLNNKWALYSAHGAKRLKDGRRLRYAKIESPLSEEDRKMLVADSLLCGGRVTQAYREALQAGELSSQVTERFTENPASKSYLPESIRREIRPEVNRLKDFHHGSRQHQLNGAHFSRDYSGMFAGDSFTADDCTCPVAYWVPDSSTREGYRILRGQLILMVDERTGFALGYALNSEPTYNSRIIRSLVTSVHDNYGLPRRCFRFENGIWRARILSGVDGVSADETEQGLEEYDITVRHVKLPRGKIVESVLGTIQNQMERLPGYVGRDERNDRFERVQKQIQQARSGAIHPSTFLLSKDQWTDELVELLERYNREPKSGKMLNGLSPLEGWNQFQSDVKLTRLGGLMRYLMAHHKVKMTVRKNMIRLRESLGGATYCDATTGKLNGQEVLVWCDPGNLDYIGVTSVDRKQGPFVVKRLDDLPALDATREQMAAGAAQIAEAQDYAKTVYRSISARLATHQFRSLFADAAAIKQGEEMEKGIARVRAEKKKKGRDASRLSAAAQQLGVRVSGVKPEAMEDTARGLELLSEAFAEADENHSIPDEPKVAVTIAPPAASRAYKLKGATAQPGIEQLRKIYWPKWNQVQRVAPGIDRSAVTRRALGLVRPMKQLSAEQLEAVISAFDEIIKKERLEQSGGLPE